MGVDFVTETLPDVQSIQIRSEYGRVLSKSLKGVNNLKELSSITLTGTVDPSSAPDNFIINAIKIHVEDK